jgi:energy-coupling factor transporter ATP-binding protein EcfA2
MKDEQDQGASSGPPSGEEGPADTSASRLRLRSLKVHSFRDVQPGTELRFGDGFHLILGKNGSGKSTLLQLLAAISTLNFRGAFFAETPFHLEASFEVGKFSLHAEIRRTFEKLRVDSKEAQYLNLPPRDEAEVIVQVEHPDISLCQWVRARSGEDLCVFTEDPRRDGARRIQHKGLAGLDPLKLSLVFALMLGAMVEDNGQLHLLPEGSLSSQEISMQPGTGAPFDEALKALQAMAADSITVAFDKYYRPTNPWLPPALYFYAQGGPVELDLSRAPLLTGAITRLGYDGAILYFGPAVTTPTGWSYSAPLFQFFRKGGVVRRLDQLSFGQQRLFSFAWYLACNPHVAIADELVNGLHSEWIDWCVEAIGDRQCFLTSQNPILVDSVPLSTEEDIRGGIILCESVHDAERDVTELRWRQMDDRESELIARALQNSRLDLLSDLLHALDLW